MSLLCATCATCVTCAERMLEIQSEVLAMGHLGRHLSREKPERVLYVNLTRILRQQFSAREYRIMCFRIFEKKWIERNTTTLSYFSIWVGSGPPDSRCKFQTSLSQAPAQYDFQPDKQNNTKFKFVRRSMNEIFWSREFIKKLLMLCRQGHVKLWIYVG